MSKIWWVKSEQLNASQLEVVSQAGKGRGFILVGPPGSGKTNLLMLCLAAMKGRGFSNSKAVVFTGALRDFIASGLTSYKLEQGDVETLIRVASEIVREHGGQLNKTLPFGERQAEWRTALKSYLDTTIHRMFDALLVDESQDFDAAEINSLFAVSAYTAFAIDTNQSIYIRNDKKHPAFALQEANDLPKFTLDHHYRVGLNICRFADLIMEGRSGYTPMEGSSQYKEYERASTVELDIFSTAIEEYARIVARASSQLTVYPGETIGIVFPKVAQLDSFRSYCESIDSSILDATSHDPDGLRARLFVGTMHEAKGLEFAAVHVGGQEKLSAFATQKTLLFTAVTRARYACYITASGNIPKYLDSAYKRLTSPAPFVLASIFPGDAL